MPTLCNGYYEVRRLPSAAPGGQHVPSSIAEYEWRPRRGDLEWRTWEGCGISDLARHLRNRLRPLDEWVDEDGDVLWFRWPIEEPPQVTCPLSSDWLMCWEPEGGQMILLAAEDMDKEDEGLDFTDYYTHWLPLPDCRELWVDGAQAREADDG